MTYVYPVGIDLGTTNSVVAYLTEAGQTAMVANELGAILTPSVVYFDDDATVVGREAKKALTFARDSVVACAKRDLGHDGTTDVVRGRQLPPETIEACVLAALGKDIAREFDDYRAVITVPAFFDERRRGLTLAAGRIAGLQVLDIVNEPTAAALAFGEQLGYLTSDGAPRDSLTLMVYDLGGGTFDVTIIQIVPGEVRTLSTDGDVTLGGFDWDRRLLEYVAQKFEDEQRIDFRDDSDACAKVLQSCEEAKHTLTARNHAVVAVDFRGHHSEIMVTREAFEELTEDLLERTIVTARHTTDAAGLDWPSIDRILLVGGSTRMPMVLRRLSEITGKMPDEAVNPDEAVARGAAIYAAATMRARGIGDTTLRLRVIDVNSHSLGVEGIDQATNRTCNTVLIPRNSPLPAMVGYKFVTKETDQQSLVIKVLEGEGHTVAGCTSLGKAVLRDLPANLPKGHPIEVVFHCRQNGQLDVTANVTGTNHAVTVQFQRQRSMPANELRNWQQAVSDGAMIDDLERLLNKTQLAENRPPPMRSDSESPTIPSESAQRVIAKPVVLVVGILVGILLLTLLIKSGLFGLSF